MKIALICRSSKIEVVHGTEAMNMCNLNRPFDLRASLCSQRSQRVHTSGEFEKCKITLPATTGPSLSSRAVVCFRVHEMPCITTLELSGADSVGKIAETG